MSAEPETTVVTEEPKPEASGAASSDRNLELLFDVPLQLSAELGGCRMTVKEVLQLSRGKVIELEKLAGEPLDILLNGQLIAHGEAVVVNERFGIRIVDIASPRERLSRLQR